MIIAEHKNGETALRKAPESIQLGLWGPTLREQGFDLLLDPKDVDHFMADDAAISRLHVRGVISTSAHIKAREKLAAIIKRAIAAPRQT